MNFPDSVDNDNVDYEGVVVATAAVGVAAAAALFLCWLLNVPATG